MTPKSTTALASNAILFGFLVLAVFSFFESLDDTHQVATGLSEQIAYEAESSSKSEKDQKNFILISTPAFEEFSTYFEAARGWAPSLLIVHSHSIIRAPPVSALS